ncbi:ABC transporter ATP-binding protein [Desulfovibrio sp. OttesenSCG-928-I05]|nr:ABC transporter ATP-binding protein [Desulfovibrio sp. OttesenSCG-928-I05]
MLAGKHITAHYPGAAVPALHDVSCHVDRGEILGVLGPNGSGKSTLLSALSGMLALREGTALLDGVDVTALSHRERARRMAWVPQRPENIPDLTVRDMVLMGRYAHLPFLGRYGAGDKALVEAAMREADVERLADRSACTLSGGEFQRALAARAFAQCAPAQDFSGEHDETFFLDEPSAGLDAAHAVALFDTVRQRVARYGSRVVVAIHDCNLAALYCDRMVFLQGGRVLASGTVTELYTESMLYALYGARFSIVPHPTTGLPQALLIPGESA